MATLASLRVRSCRTFYCKTTIRNNHTGESAQMSNNLGGYLSLGVVSGGLGSLMGLGGAFIALPVMTGYFLVPQNVAHGTSIAVVLATSLGACYSYSNREAAKEDAVAPSAKLGKTFLGIPEVIGSVNMVNAAALALTSSVTVVFGAMLSKRLHGVHLKLIHGSMMLICAPLIAFKEHFKGTPTASIENKDSPDSPLEFTALPPSEQFDKLVRPMSIGMLTGTLAGLLGVGGGLIMVPALNFFTDMDYQTSLGTSLAGSQRSFIPSFSCNT